MVCLSCLSFNQEKTTERIELSGSEAAAVSTAYYYWAAVRSETRWWGKDVDGMI